MRRKERILCLFKFKQEHFVSLIKKKLTEFENFTFEKISKLVMLISDSKYSLRTLADFCPSKKPYQL